MFRDWIFRNFQLAPRDNAVRVQLTEEMDGYCHSSMLERRRAEPQDDLLTLIAHGEIDGRADRSRTAGRVRHADDPRRHRHDVERDRFRAVALRPASRSTRRGSSPSPTTTRSGRRRSRRCCATTRPSRWAARSIADTEVAGCPVHAGEQTLVTFPAANHDPDAFEDAHEFRIDRAINRHVAFGLGIHRCLGSNLARLELTVALQEWLRAFPDFELDPDRADDVGQRPGARPPQRSQFYSTDQRTVRAPCAQRSSKQSPAISSSTRSR